ncbi:alpha/beta fold hydrolase [Microbacterium sp. ARD32]|uniref:acyl-CoA thioester hydrolase/BAAT C-terminal domain-containing protein n=1 Tax=Microbacterium sp. ARD32 TaxID=2962577 RepID=UPI0028824BE5|nr:acyl-CoA thioester hydrolase/BAAT C-terminal domain-containing protein [Microbacterium sp. ARD32]MDT0157197.1 alpha/beta fold hydrolase [Microbacterium sp. ARD32]
MVASEDRFEAVPAAPNGTGVLLLAGSSGRVERERAELLATTGARVRAIRWFGGEGQRPSPHEVPVELFASEIESLLREVDRIVLFGTSFGAEAVLVTASRYAVDGVIAVAPSSVVWAGADAGSWSSHWTHGGEPVPYVAFDPSWSPKTDPPAFVSLYETSLLLDADATAAARIPVGDIAGEVLLIAGGDDQVWPSARFAAEVEAARSERGLVTTVVTHPGAGHRLLLPGESPAVGGVAMRRGGSPEADAELGARAWPEIRRMLQAAR